MKTIKDWEIRKAHIRRHLERVMGPLPFMACVAEDDEDFAAAGVREVMDSAGAVYSLFSAETELRSVTATVPHSFPQRSRDAASEFLKTKLLRVED